MLAFKLISLLLSFLFRWSARAQMSTKPHDPRCALFTLSSIRNCSFILFGLPIQFVAFEMQFQQNGSDACFAPHPSRLSASVFHQQPVEDQTAKSHKPLSPISPQRASTAVAEREIRIFSLSLVRGEPLHYFLRLETNATPISRATDEKTFPPSCKFLGCSWLPRFREHVTSCTEQLFCDNRGAGAEWNAAAPREGRAVGV